MAHLNAPAPRARPGPSALLEAWRVFDMLVVTDQIQGCCTKVKVDRTPYSFTLCGQHQNGEWRLSPNFEWPPTHSRLLPKTKLGIDICLRSGILGNACSETLCPFSSHTGITSVSDVETFPVRILLQMPPFFKRWFVNIFPRKSWCSCSKGCFFQPSVDRVVHSFALKTQQSPEMLLGTPRIIAPF